MYRRNLQRCLKTRVAPTAIFLADTPVFCFCFYIQYITIKRTYVNKREYLLDPYTETTAAPKDLMQQLEKLQKCLRTPQQ